MSVAAESPVPTVRTVRKRRRRLSLRARLVLLSTAGLAVGLVVGGVALTAALRIGLEQASDDAAAQTAQEVVTLIDSDRLPDPVPVGGTTLVQVVDRQGRVLAASSGADRLVPALNAGELAAALAGPTAVPGSRFGVDGPVRVVARRAGPDDAPRTVVVGAPAGDIDSAVRVVRAALIVGFTVLLAALAAVAWRIVGATLRPVEVLRAGAEKITGSGSNDTLPVPTAADEIRRLAETLNGMLARLGGSRRRQRAFVADAAHELRSPLASLRTQLDVALVTGDPPDTADLLVEVDRLTGLVNDLLILARVDDATPPPKELLDVTVVVAEVAERYTAARVPVSVTAPNGAPNSSPTSGPAVPTVPTVPTPLIHAEPSAITRAIANILDNAVRYATTSVTLSAGQAQDGGALVVVADDGPGIPGVDRERVFERFTRLHDARDRQSGGSGLGLAIVGELIRQQGGSVTLDDASPGGDPPGLRVELRFPPAGVLA